MRARRRHEIALLASLLVAVAAGRAAEVSQSSGAGEGVCSTAKGEGFEIFRGENNVYGLVGTSDAVSFLGVFGSAEECAAAAQAASAEGAGHDAAGGSGAVLSFAFHARDFADARWRGRCYGRRDPGWGPRRQAGVDSGRARGCRQGQEGARSKNVWGDALACNVLEWRLLRR